MTRNQIFNYIALHFDDKVYLTSNYEETPAQFPCIMARMIGLSRPTRFMNLSFDDSVGLMTWEVQIVSTKKNKAQTEAYNLMETIKECFNDLYFILDMCEPIESSASKYKLVARFHRNLGGGESVPNYQGE